MKRIKWASIKMFSLLLVKYAIYLSKYYYDLFWNIINLYFIFCGAIIIACTFVSY